MSLTTVFNYFANSLWQVPLMAACCWCALRLARASAGVRYVAWIGTLLLCVALPWRGAEVREDATVTVSTGVAVATAQATPTTLALPFYAVRITTQTRDRLAELYLALTALLLLRLTLSYAEQRRLLHHAAMLSASQAEDVFALGWNAARVRVLPCPHTTPMVAGVWRPRVLLPHSLFEGERATLQAVLAHEFAHLARRDTLVNLVLRVVALPVAYHPATAMIEREIQHNRELLCDAVAARSLNSQTAYAQALLRLAQQIVHTGGEVPRNTVGLFARTSKPLLEERIMNLIAPPVSARFGFRWLRVSAASGLLCTAIATVSFVHLTPSVMAAEQQAPAASEPLNRLNPAKSEQLEAKPTARSIRRTKGATSDSESNRPLAATGKEIGVTAADLDKELAGLRSELDSPEMKKQLESMREIDMAAIADSIKRSQHELLAARKQLDSPQFKREIAEAKATVARAQADMPRLIAEAQQQALLAQGTTLRMAQEPTQNTHVDAAVMAALVYHKVTPIYPPIAKAAKVSGTVVFAAVIGKNGTVKELHYVSGPEMLKSSTIEALRQWVYQPYLLNGQPTEVETTISVTYTVPE